MMKTKHMTIIGILAALVLAPAAAGQDYRPDRRGRQAFDGPGQGTRQQWRQPQSYRQRQGQMQRNDGFGPGAMRQQGRRGSGPEAGPMGQFDIGGRIRMMTRFADLTDEQKTAVREIAQAHRQAAREHQRALQEANRALRQAVVAGDIEQVEQNAAAVAEAITDQAVAEAAVINAVRAELTDEQLEKLDQMRQRMQERAEQFRRNRTDRRRESFQPGQGRRFHPQRQPRSDVDQDAQ